MRRPMLHQDHCRPLGHAIGEQLWPEAKDPLDAREGPTNARGRRSGSPTCGRSSTTRHSAAKPKPISENKPAQSHSPFAVPSRSQGVLGKNVRTCFSSAIGYHLYHPSVGRWGLTQRSSRLCGQACLFIWTSGGRSAGGALSRRSINMFVNGRRKEMRRRSNIRLSKGIHCSGFESLELELIPRVASRSGGARPNQFRPPPRNQLLPAPESEIPSDTRSGLRAGHLRLLGGPPVDNAPTIPVLGREL